LLPSSLKGAALQRFQQGLESAKFAVEEGEVRYMVAAKLPRYMYLCNEHYLKIRGRLERALEHILLEDGLEPKQGDVDEGDNSQF
jgi:hypothetical protein